MYFRKIGKRAGETTDRYSGVVNVNRDSELY
uniref:Uncharacterized protein n=1 Tax=Myoviridae sp. ctBtT5 TaxID=2825048 RepID=A0A8S5PYM8_9CAUD|nr:MAG TPA: hypothetical protein [Myoviridae sp. ctBtT5]